MRHLVEWWKGNEIDDGVGEIELDIQPQVAINAIFLMHLDRDEKDKNNFKPRN